MRAELNPFCCQTLFPVHCFTFLINKSIKILQILNSIENGIYVFLGSDTPHSDSETRNQTGVVMHMKLIYRSSNLFLTCASEIYLAILSFTTDFPFQVNYDGKKKKRLPVSWTDIYFSM